MGNHRYFYILICDIKTYFHGNMDVEKTKNITEYSIKNVLKSD